MAKNIVEKLNGTLKFIAWIVFIVFAAGGLYARITGQVNANKTLIDEIKPKVEQNEKQIIKIDKDLEYIKKGIDEIKKVVKKP